ncbi:MAG TPA: glutamyl-tRNA reductase [Candidatus Paceibacterota bacterium]|nr:glutamyl-tRNA reductase [Verrucomicrobiota bacterium]HRY50210.1 glutamyl-tRNA reductase [Candidatus Paceibacterota bacterium]
MPIVVIGLSHHTAPVEVREKLAFSEAMIPESLTRMCEQGLAQEAVILSTCNRVEIYAVTQEPALMAHASLKQFLRDAHQYEEPLDNSVYFRGEPQSLEHLFRVACGLDSMVLGETEILGQLKHAYELARLNKSTGNQLNRVFQKAFNVAKQVRTETNIQRGSVSVASVAVELAEKIFSTLKGQHVMVLGAGDTSEKTARALMSRGAGSLVVSNRTFERAQALAAELGGRAVSFHDWPKIFEPIDIVISCTAAPDYLIDRTLLGPLMKERKNRPLLLIDIAVPRDVQPEVNLLDNVYLYNIDDLQSIADSYLRSRQEEIAHCEKIIREKIRALLGRRGESDSSVSGGLALGKS